MVQTDDLQAGDWINFEERLNYAQFGRRSLVAFGVIQMTKAIC
jgi:hypothetical protein